jgi:hypothetical protein
MATAVDWRRTVSLVRQSSPDSRRGVDFDHGRIALASPAASKWQWQLVK